MAGEEHKSFKLNNFTFFPLSRPHFEIQFFLVELFLIILIESFPNISTLLTNKLT